MSNIVAIVGRPNVGKSTLFNRLLGERVAIMDNESGVTRDRHYGYSYWGGKNFTVIDTGGYVVGSKDVFEGAIRDQVMLALEEADAILFMVDITAGVTDMDKDFANVARRSKKPILLVSNKADTGRDQHYVGEFYSLGLGEPYAVSAMTGTGTGELLDELVKHLQADPPEWLAELRRSGPHPRPVVAQKLGISTSGLARAGVDDTLTTAEIKALLEQKPGWLVEERARQAAVRDDAQRVKFDKAAKDELRAKNT